MFKDKVLLVTGGTGSFGNAVVKKFIDSGIKEIRIFSRDEKKQWDMQKLYHNDKLKFYIGDVRDETTLDDAMSGVDFVFHASALKQVPSCERFPYEAVKTNIVGTNNVLDSAIKHCVKKAVVLSTDKAVYPVNAMGISKAMAERIAVAKATDQSATVICRTRYGNVMCSRGSVIPLFKKQIECGVALTVTNKDMTRYMMTLDDAVDLVVYAFVHGDNGDLFVQKSPASTIGNLAEAVKEIMNSKLPTKIVGTRYGEKLHETLLTKEEMSAAVDLGGYFKVNSIKPFETVDDCVEYNSANTYRLNKEEMIKLLKKTGEFK